MDAPSYPIAAEPLALRRNLLPTPGAWLEGPSSSWLGAALRVQASRLWDRRLSLPPPPLALITGVQAAARRARKGRAGASGAPAHACAGSAAEAWG